MARVSIITLAKRPWLLRSTQRHLPALDLPALLVELGITVYFAQEEEACCPGAVAAEDWSALKRSAVARCLGDWRCSGALRGARLSVLSVGDSEAEQRALKDVLANEAPGRPLCKTVKLMDSPGLAELGEELAQLTALLRGMMMGRTDFDICITHPGELSLKALALQA